MFKNDFQGGSYFEIFSAQGKDSLNNWKVSGAAGIRKEFEKYVKSFVYVLDGPVATTKMQLPKDSKQTLCLIQKFLIFQVFVPKGQDFSIDVGISDLSGSKRRLFMSTSHKETHITPLHSKIPLNVVLRDKWLNLCFDLVSLVGDTWRGQTFKSVESLCISASCRVRRIFTMKFQPPDTTNDYEKYGIPMLENEAQEFDTIPKQCQLAPDVEKDTQVINIRKINYCDGKGLRHSESSSGVESLDLNSSLVKRSTHGEFHIAFGTKMSGINQRRSSASSNRDGSASGRTARGSAKGSRPNSGTENNGKAGLNQPSSSTNDGSQTGRERKNSDPGSNPADPDMAIDKASLRTSRTWTDGADGMEEIPFVRPHPPAEPSSDRSRRRKPRIKSADKARPPQNSADASRSSKSTAVNGNQNANQHFHQGIVGSHVANEEEEASIMAAMQMSMRREQKKSGSESEPGSHNTSGTRDGDDSLTEIIDTLQTHGTRLYGYEESDGTDDEDEGEEEIYVFSSHPRQMASEQNKTKKKKVPTATLR